MQPYANLGGDSRVIAFETGPGWIRIQFSDYSVYLYTDESAGAATIERMGSLARAGRGLNAFINTHVKFKYARKER